MRPVASPRDASAARVCASTATPELPLLWLAVLVDWLLLAD